MNEQNIKLNFLSLTPQEFSFTVFRKEYNQEDITDWVFKYRLPKSLGETHFHDFSITLDPKEGFTSFICHHNTNKDLALKVIYYNFTKAVKEKGIEITLGKKFYDRHVDFILKKHSKGNEKISLNSYFLRQENKYGFLIDFFFKDNQGEQLKRASLKLCLAV